MHLSSFKVVQTVTGLLDSLLFFFSLKLNFYSKDCMGRKTTAKIKNNWLNWKLEVVDLQESKQWVTALAL